MPLPAIAAGVAIGMGLGYVEDRYFGDGNYTAKEAAIDGTLGGLGVGGVIKTGKYGYRSYKWAKRARKARKAGGTTEYTIMGVRTGHQIMYRDAFEIAQLNAVKFTVHGGAAATSQALDNYTNRERGKVVQVRNPLDSDYVVIRHPLALALSATVSGKSSMISKSSKSRSQKRCRCKDGTYSTKCCK